jgi:glycosyltransferase involved in cell wall biosynthesis
MKFFINENFEDKTSGKIKFLGLLSRYLQDMGLKLESNNPDVLLHIGRDYKKYIKKSKLICRLDGLAINTDQDYKSSNNKIYKAIKDSNAIVYQNIFCKDSYESFFPKLKKQKSKCIFNGNVIKSHNAKEFSFLANVKWRPHKRVKETAECFARACEMGLNSKLYITGEVCREDRIKHNSIIYVGWVQDVVLEQFLAKCSFGLHLAWLDWCPNTVVEYLCNGMSVLCSSSGGTRHVVKDSGIYFADNKWDFKPHKLYSPPKIDVDHVAGKIIELTNIKNRDSSHVDICNVARQYSLFFNEVCNEK